MGYGPDVYFDKEVSVLEMDGKFNNLQELIYVESHLRTPRPSSTASSPSRCSSSRTPRAATTAPASSRPSAPSRSARSTRRSRRRRSRPTRSRPKSDRRHLSTGAAASQGPTQGRAYGSPGSSGLAVRSDAAPVLFFEQLHCISKREVVK